MKKPEKVREALPATNAFDVALAVRGGRLRLRDVPAEQQPAVQKALGHPGRLAQYARDRAAAARSHDDRTRFAPLDHFLDRVG